MIIYNIKNNPITFREAMASRDSDFRQEAINDEMDSLMANKARVQVVLPPGCRPIVCR